MRRSVESPLSSNQRPFKLEQARRDTGLIPLFRRVFETSPEPCQIIDPRPGLHIVDINDAFGAVTMTRRDRIVGDRLFDVFPDNPDDPWADGIVNIFASLEIASAKREADAIGVQRYDIRDLNGRFHQRYWRVVNSPLYDSAGRLLYLLNHPEDVTSKIAAN